MTDGEDIDVLSINSIRCLAIDAIERASSGHPGAPMGLAPVGYTLWQRFLRHNPANPEWPGRDRFVLSAGHASMLIYSLLYLTGYDLSPEDLMAFRQLGSRTPGHPEYGHTAGIEVTTGPLGQGISNAVGMALARELVRARFNRPGYDLGDYYVYVIASDGDMMEGVASEACSLAGHLGLGRLIVLYDDNHITIEGTTALSFSEDVAGRFSAYGWAVQRVPDANDIEAVADAITAARLEDSAPSLIMAHSHIACGSPNLEGSEESHGAPLGADEAILTKENLGWASGEFCVPGEVLLNMRRALQLGAALEGEWNEMMDSYTSEHAAEAEEYRRVTACRLPGGWEEHLPAFETGTRVSTRGASGKVLASLAGVMPELVGGSADLGPSNKTFIKGYGSISRGDFSGRNIHFGVREHGMAAIMNGMARHGGIIPYGGTFLVFADYMRPAIRMAALMGLKVVYVFTHDSLGVGEDGPTHQPVEQLASLRAMPGLVVIRPADANETSVAWRVALARNGPTALALSRQDLPVLDRVVLASAEGLLRGAYVLAGSEVPGLTLVGTGSEVALAIEARAALAAEGIDARVVSMPSWELFDEQEEDYRGTVLPPTDKILSVEAGVTMGWRRHVGDSGDVIGFDRFGMSAPGGIALAEAGFTVANVVERAKALLR
ncbi:MAG: transketolase [Actinomycetota bacterium]